MKEIEAWLSLRVVTLQANKHISYVLIQKLLVKGWLLPRENTQSRGKCFPYHENMPWAPYLIYNLHNQATPSMGEQPAWDTLCGGEESSLLPL